MKTRYIFPVILAIVLAAPNIASAGGSGGAGDVSWKGAQTASVLDSGVNLTPYVEIFVDSLLSFGKTLISGLATGGSHSPTPSGAITSVVPGTAAVAVELAITDYHVSRSQQRAIANLGPMVEDGTLSVEEATKYVMIQNYTPGAGRQAVEAALSEYLR